MTPKIRKFAVSAYASLMGISGVAIGFAVVQAQATGYGAEPELIDVQVGEAGPITRVAVLCEPACRAIEESAGIFHLPGVNVALTVDVGARVKNARAILLEPVDGGTQLSIVSARTPDSASVRSCSVNGQEAACIDFHFPSGFTPTEAAPTSTKEPAQAAPVSEAPTIRNGEANVTAAAREPIPNLAAVQFPQLREPEIDKFQFAHLAPPERLAPPSMNASLGDVGSANDDVFEDVYADGFEMPQFLDQPDALRGAASDEDPVLPQGVSTEHARTLSRVTDFEAEARRILQKDLDVNECASSQARLDEDAWALDALIDVGFCKALEGDLAGADKIFSRLLEYTPDNYTALVGRALIAAKAGERSVARKYFQDALDALPPIEESNRIVEAMAEL